MVWRVELDAAAERELDNIDPQMARRILAFLYKRVVRLEDPRSIGRALKGTQFNNLWRYRVEDYRIICSIEDNILCVLVVRIAHRREVYRKVLK